MSQKIAVLFNFFYFFLRVVLLVALLTAIVADEEPVDEILADEHDGVPDMSLKYVTLEEVLLTDIFGEVLLDHATHDKCHPANASGTFYHTMELNPPYFDNDFIPQEKNLFLLEMGHDDPDPNKSWRIRVGKGGNIYSYVSALGETMPPNRKAGQWMVDEVWQTVSVDSEMNRSPYGTYFIHQAGVYQKDSPYTDHPFFFSPTIAHWCSPDRRECRTAAWGQHAWTPTKYLSKALYINRYRDCGDGVMEFTSVVHNAENQKTSDLKDYAITTITPRFNYISFPWFGCRDTVYQDVLIKKKGGGDNGDDAWTTNWPNPDYMNSRYVDDIINTGGFSVFAEHRRGRPEFKFPGLFEEPERKWPTLRVKWMGNEDRNVKEACEPFGAITVLYEAYHVRCRIAGLKQYPGRCPGCLLTFTNGNTGQSFDVVNVQHWSIKTSTPANPSNVHHNHFHIFFAPKYGLTENWITEASYNETFAEEVAAHLNTMLSDGDEIVVTWTEGKHDDDNHCVSFVFGDDQEIRAQQEGGSSLAMYWDGGTKFEYGDVYNWGKQYMVVNEVQNIWMDPGTTFGKNQYIIAGTGLSTISNHSQEFVPYVVQDYNDVGDLPATQIDLVLSFDRQSFGYTLGGNRCFGAMNCTGYSTPQTDDVYGFTIPYFYITCGSDTYVGPNLYHFAMVDTETLIRRAYICDETDVTKRPTVKLLGYFSDKECPFLKNAVYDEKWCRGGMGTASDSPSVAPSEVPTVVPTVSLVPTAEPTVSSAPTISGKPTFISEAPTKLYDFDLEKVLLEDIFGERLLGNNNDTKCNPSQSSGTFDYSFDFSSLQPVADDFATQEELLFLAEMVHNDVDPNKSWRVRIGTGGNIYSYVSTLGETMPPNVKHPHSYMVEDVWQTIAIDARLNGGKDGLYHIHQSGPFQTSSTSSSPVFSPSIAHYCTDRECRFASWGQQAHIPTKFVSKALIFTRYRDCGDGVLEISSVIHNAENSLTSDMVGYDVGSSQPMFGYMAFPWLAVRNTVYRDLLVGVSNAAAGDDGGDDGWVTSWPLPTTKAPMEIELKDTDGFSVFAEKRNNRPLFTFPGYTQANLDLIPNFTFVGEKPCIPVKANTVGTMAYHLRCEVVGERVYQQGCEGCALTFTVDGSGGTVDVVTVKHWCYKSGKIYYIFFAPQQTMDRVITDESYDYTLARKITDAVNGVLANAYITISWTEGKVDDENHCLAFVHGTDEELKVNDASVERYWGGYGRIYFGGERDFLRQSTNFQEILWIWTKSGTTYGKNHYIIADKGLSTVSTRAREWADSAIQDFNDIGDLPSTRINLMLTNDNQTFGFTFDDVGCIGSESCRGYSTPQADDAYDFTVPHFFITCGNNTYFGPNLYYFAPYDPETKIRVSYICDENDTSLRPNIKLIGYFSDGACAAFQNATFDETYCKLNKPIKITTSPSMSLNPSDTPTNIPSSSPSNNPSSHPSLRPTSNPSISPTKSHKPSGTTPTHDPTPRPTISPAPSTYPSSGPSITFHPSRTPTFSPSLSTVPSKTPTTRPTLSQAPSARPSSGPTVTLYPSVSPTVKRDSGGGPSPPRTSVPRTSAPRTLRPRSPQTIAPRTKRPITGRPTRPPTTVRPRSKSPTLMPVTKVKPTSPPTIIKPTNPPTIAALPTTPTSPPQLNPSCIQPGDVVPSSWMSASHGLSLRINAGYNYLTAFFNTDDLINQIRTHFTPHGLKWIVLNLSSPYKGDRYLAPHSILTPMNIGSTPKTITGRWGNANPFSPTSLDRDLFGEILNGLSSLGIRVIAYMAAQGPLMTTAGESRAYDYNNAVPYVDSCALCPGLTGRQAPYCHCAPSVWRWKRYVAARYRSITEEEGLRMAYADLIVGEYARRYGLKLSGFFFDQGAQAAMSRIHSVVTRYNPGAVLSFNTGSATLMTALNVNFPYESVTFGYAAAATRTSSSSCVNFSAVTAVEKSEGGYFCVNRKGTLSHVQFPINDEWNAGGVVWTSDRAAEWQSRVLAAKGAWTWGVKLGLGRFRSEIHNDDVMFLKAVYATMATTTATAYQHDCASMPTPSPTTTQPTNFPTRTKTDFPTRGRAGADLEKSRSTIPSDVDWMSGNHGISIKISAGFNYISAYYDARAFVKQCADLLQYGLTWVVINLSNYGGDQYLAPHPILTTLNPGSTPKTVGGRFGSSTPLDATSSDRDLFKELLDGLTTIGLRVLAYMAAQGPAMLSSEEIKAYDYSNKAPYIDSCALCPDLTGYPAPYCQCAPSVWRWKRYVTSMYGSDDERYLKMAYADIIVGEYAERYGEKLSGYFFDQGQDAEMDILYERIRNANSHAILSFNKGQKMPLKYNNFPYEDMTFGYPHDLRNYRASDCTNLPLVSSVENQSYGGYFYQNWKKSLGHVNVPVNTDWNTGYLVWNVEKAAEWMARVLNAGGAWTWSPKRGFGLARSEIYFYDLAFLKAVYKKSFTMSPPYDDSDC